MRSPIPDDLDEALESVTPDSSGAPRGYIPELAAADRERLAAVLATVDLRSAEEVLTVLSTRPPSRPGGRRCRRRFLLPMCQ